MLNLSLTRLLSIHLYIYIRGYTGQLSKHSFTITWIGRPQNRGSVPRRNKGLYLLHIIQADHSVSHPASCPMGSGDSFLQGKAAGA
jgi:hypothetical protein